MWLTPLLTAAWPKQRHWWVSCFTMVASKPVDEGRNGDDDVIVVYSDAPAPPQPVGVLAESDSAIAPVQKKQRRGNRKEPSCSNPDAFSTSSDAFSTSREDAIIMWRAMLPPDRSDAVVPDGIENVPYEYWWNDQHLPECNCYWCNYLFGEDRTDSLTI